MDNFEPVGETGNFEPVGEAISFNSRQVKETLRGIIRRYRIAERAFLPMARYDQLDRPVPVLCVKFRRGVPRPMFEAFMQEVGAALQQMLGDVRFDLIPLDGKNERNLRAVCSAFFDRSDVAAQSNRG